MREAYEEVSELVSKQIGFVKTVSSLQLSELENNTAIMFLCHLGKARMNPFQV